MASVEKRSFSLPTENLPFIEAKVSAGDYASESDVIRAALAALQERDAAVERWLREDVAPVYDAMHAEPDRAISIDSVFDEVRARYALRSKDRG